MNNYATNMPVIAMGATNLLDKEMKSYEEIHRYIDLVAQYTHYNLITWTMRNQARQMTDKNVHDWFKNVVNYAKDKGINSIIDLDVRQSILEFIKRYPDNWQQRLWLQEVELDSNKDTVSDVIYDQHHADAIYKWSNAISIEQARVYSYEKTEEGKIKFETVVDISSQCQSEAVSYKSKLGDRQAQKLTCTIPVANSNKKTACIISLVTFDYPDAFSPDLLKFETEVVKQYADLDLAGLMKDECGLPATHDGNPQKNGFWYSKYRVDLYAKRTDGNDLIRDSLLMYLGEQGRDTERQAAVNHFMDTARLCMTKIGENFYHDTKETFGQDAFVGVHETVIPYPDAREFERNGLSWWTAQRDVAQSDEVTPYCCRTSMAKKFGSAIWYNQWYAPTADLYEKTIWSYALAGGRINFHPLPPTDLERMDRQIPLMRSGIQRADCRITMLNFISKSPLNCPVAVIFGHASAMNWAGPAYENVGMKVADAFWAAGYYADLIPSTELQTGALSIDEDGRVKFGTQSYAAVVLCNTEYEGDELAEFLQRAAKGKTILARTGQWTVDFNAKPIDVETILPAEITLFEDIDLCSKTIINRLKKIGLEAQTPATVTLPKWHNLGDTSLALPASGMSQLIDGTKIIVAGENNASGDRICKTIMINGYAVEFDAIGIAAVRLDDEGNLIAMAVGSLKKFKCQKVEITLPTDSDIDIAIYKDEQGIYQGVIQGHTGGVPESLMAITSNWQKLELPETFPNEN
jgi:hypothetical protein